MNHDRPDAAERVANAHPYSRLPAAKFWRSGVAEIDFGRLQNLWTPKFAVNARTTIATAGSCFAQHVGAALKRRGYRWLDSEPAPESVPAAQREAEGYGVFSFRTGNVYTTAALLQWLRWAAGTVQPPEEVIFDGDAYHDPFRPRFPTSGYATAAALHDARGFTLAAMARTLRGTDLFVFTLGLTEAWRHRAGWVYPICPGTLRGEFRADEHAFHNYGYTEILDELDAAWALLRSFNPNMRLLLTVSPVPLTATATEQHVLSATVYSKSVLRAAAGDFASRHADVDYFPSYELIASAPAKGRYFEANLRSVRRQGIELVMGTLFAAWEGRMHSEPTEAEPAPAAIEPESGGDICDDLVLDTLRRSRTMRARAEQPRVVLIGDSQMGMMAKVLDELDVPYVGGAIMQATEWHAGLFKPTGDAQLFMPTVAEGAEIWAQAGPQFAALASGEMAKNALVITNIGSHTVAMIVKQGGRDGEFVRYLELLYPQGTPRQVSVEVLACYVASRRVAHLTLLQRLVQTGVPVVWVSDPPTFTPCPEFCALYDALITKFVAMTGCSVFHAREWIAACHGELPQQFRSREIDPVSNEPDWVHAAPEFYRAQFLEILQRQKLPLEALVR